MKRRRRRRGTYTITTHTYTIPLYKLSIRVLKGLINSGTCFVKFKFLTIFTGIVIRLGKIFIIRCSIPLVFGFTR
jgi:hypothetical protein